MGFRTLWPLVLLILVPIIILLYILKQEAKPYEFSSTLLWKEAWKNIEATKPWEKLKKNLLLFLQIFTVLLLILALMNPWLKGLGSKKEQVVLVVDNSASMNTRYEASQTRLEAAKETACDYLEGLSQGTAIHIIAGNQQASLLLSGSQDIAEAKRVINNIEATNLAGDLSTALGLVQSCMAQSESTDIVFLTDTAFDMGDLEATVLSFYSEQENLSADSISCSADSEKMTVLAQISNYAETAQDREINLYGQTAEGKEVLLDIQPVSVAAGETAAVYFTLDVNEAGILTTTSAGLDQSEQEIQVLKAEINEADALMEDNSTWCVAEQVKTNRILLLSGSNLFLEKALNNIANTELYRTSDVDIMKASGDVYNLYIFDGMVPETLPASGNFLFINCEAPEIFENCGQVQGKQAAFVESEVTSFLVDKSFGANVLKLYQIPTWGKTFLETDGGTAGFYGIYNGHKIAALGLDLHDTDLGLKAEFPVLVSHLADYLLENGLTEDNHYTAGERISLHGSTQGSDLIFRQPGGDIRQIAVEEAYGAYVEVKNIGVYEVTQEVEGTVLQQKLAVNFPVQLESQVQNPQDVSEGTQQKQQIETRAATAELRNYILVVLLLLLIVEWIVYVKSR